MGEICLASRKESNRLPFIARSAVALGAVLSLFLWGVAPALAHANLQRSDPAPNAVVPEAPQRIRLWFSEPVEPGFTQMAVLDKAGARVDNQDSSVDSAEQRVLVVSVPPLSPGPYTVSWQALSKVDGHITRGSFSFVVGQPGMAGGSADTSPPQKAKETGLALETVLQAVFRGMNLLGVAVVVGGLFFWPLVARPALAAAMPVGSADAIGRQIWRRVFLLSVGGMALILLSLIGTLLSQAAALTVSPVALFSLRWGQWWLARAGATGLLLGYLLYLANRNRATRLRAGETVVLLLLLIAAAALNSFTAHAATIPSGAALAIILDAIHLLAGSAWIGGVVALVVALFPIAAEQAPAVRTALLKNLVPRFSQIAIGSVGALALTGLFHIWLQVGSTEALAETSYGRALIIKLLFMLPLFLVGAANLIWTRPRLHNLRVQVAFSRFVKGEMLLGAVVLVLAGILASLPPARTVANATAPGVRLENEGEGIRTRLIVEPGQAGLNSFRVEVTDTRGRPVPDVEKVALRFVFLAGDLAENELVARPGESGSYEASGTSLSIVGPWQVEVIAQRSTAYEARSTFWLDVPEVAVPRSSYPAIRMSFNTNLVTALEILALGGAAFFTASVLRRRAVKKAARMLGLTALLAGIVLAGYSQVGGGRQGASDLRATSNPFPATAQSVQTGRQLYGQHCESCHGTEGKGDGPLASSLNPPPSDLRSHTPLHGDLELFRFVQKGGQASAMPAFEYTLKPEQIWHILNYLRSF